MMERAEVKSNDAVSFRSSARQEDGRSILENRATLRARIEGTRIPRKPDQLATGRLVLTGARSLFRIYFRIYPVVGNLSVGRN